MGFLRNRLLRRFSFLGRFADLALLLGAVLRFASRKGWISEQQISSLGLDRFAPPAAKTPGVSAGALPLGEMAMAGGAAWRLLRRKKSTSRRKLRRRR